MKNIYNIILKNEKTIKIKADEVECYQKTHMIKLINNGEIAAILNMDNVVCLIDSYYEAESEEA